MGNVLVLIHALTSTVLGIPEMPCDLFSPDFLYGFTGLRNDWTRKPKLLVYSHKIIVWWHQNSGLRIKGEGHGVYLLIYLKCLVEGNQGGSVS